MSYDYGMMKLKHPVSDIRDMTANIREPMGTVEELRVIISAALPDVVWTTFSTDLGPLIEARIDRPEEGLWMEINLASWREIDDLNANTVGGPRARSVVEKLCLSAGWTAHNLQTNELFAANVIRR
jgi:hypothetical protein